MPLTEQISTCLALKRFSPFLKHNASLAIHGENLQTAVLLRRCREKAMTFYGRFRRTSSSACIYQNGHCIVQLGKQDSAAVPPSPLSST